MNYKVIYWVSSLFSNEVGKNIQDVYDTDIFPYLQWCELFIDIMKQLGFMAIKGLGTLVDYVSMCYTEIAKIDYTKIITVGDFETTLNTITWGVLVIAILVAVSMSFFRKNNDLEYIKITIIAIFAIACFGEYNTWINGFKDIGVEYADAEFKRDDLSLSEQIFYDNSFDMLASIKEGKLQTINTKIPMKHLNIVETISKNDLQGYYEYATDGTPVVKDLSDGFLNSGLFEMRYYRYSVNSMGILMLYIVVSIMFILGMAKLAYIGYDWFYIKLYGGLSMATSVTTMKKIAFAYTSTLNSMISFLFAYVGSYLFMLLIPSLLQADYNLLTRGVLMFIGGLVFILGTGFLAKAFGFDDGTAFVLKSMMLTRQLSRGMNKMKNNISNGLSKMSGKGVDGTDGGETQNDEVPKYNDSNEKYDRLENNEPRYIDEKPYTVDSKNNERHYLGDKDFKNQPLYGETDNPDAPPRNHTSDIKDKWNQNLDEKVKDKKIRYAKAMNLDTSSGMEIRNTHSPIDVDEERTTGDEDMKVDKEYESTLDTYEELGNAEEGIEEQSQDFQSNMQSEKLQDSQRNIQSEEPFDDEHYYHDEYGNTVPKGLEIKPYAQYKRDSKKDANASIYQKARNQNRNISTSKKELPTWFHNQDLVKTADEDIDDEELQRELESLNDDRSREITREKMLDEMLSNPYSSEGDRKYVNGLSERELKKEYEKFSKDMNREDE